MSDDRKPRDSKPLPAAGESGNPGEPTRTPGVAPRAAPRPVSPPGRVLTAARKERISDSRSGPLAPRLKAGAEDTALNIFSRANDALEGFKRSDRYFKYKVMIVGAWVALSIVTVLLALPQSANANNGLGAKLVIATVLDHPVYMVKNEGSETWREVVVVVNKRYRAAASELGPGQNLTIGPKQLLGDNGSLAPANLQLEEFELRTAQGNAKLMEGGQLR